MKVAIVTGGGRGIGAAVAHRLAAEGFGLVVTDVDGERAAAVAGDIGGGARAVALDVRDGDDWARVVTGVGEDLGRIDVLVNNAGVMAYGAIEEVDEAAFRAVLDVDLVGTYLGMRAVIPTMKQQHDGSIVNISSTCGLAGSGLLGAYVASKWGVRGLTKTAAIELADHGIRVNSVHPGGIDTPMVRGDLDDDVVAGVRAQHPARPSRDARRGGRAGGVPGRQPVVVLHRVGVRGRRRLHVRRSLAHVAGRRFLTVRSVSRPRRGRRGSRT